MNPKIAVITPYHQESTEVLRRCHESVAGQMLPADHFLIADGFPNEAVRDWNARHVVLPHAHGDCGNTPRGIGSMMADAEGYDFVAYLDADNWLYAQHLSSLHELWQRTKNPVCCAMRTFHRLDGSLMNISETDEDNGRHVDTSCFFIHASAFELLSVWHRMPRPVAAVCDRVFLAAVRARRFGITSSGQRTVAFRSQYAAHYRSIGEEPPAGAKGPDAFKAASDYLLSVEGVAATTQRLGFYPLAYL
jgi:hypothetical protein